MRKLFAAVLLTIAASAHAALFMTVICDYADGSSAQYSIQYLDDDTQCRTRPVIWCNPDADTCMALTTPLPAYPPLCNRRPVPLTPRYPDFY